MKLYSNIPQLFSVQFKIGLYNTDMSGKERIKEKKMKIRFFKCLDINDVLQESVSFGLIEPIDDPNQFVVQDDYEFVLGMNTGNEFYRADTGEY